MELMRTLRRVLANLRDGDDPAAVRIDIGSEPSTAYRERMDAVAQTDRYIDSLADALPESLRHALHQCVVHLQHPLLDAQALAQHVQAHQYALRTALLRSDMTPSPSEAEHLERLATVQPLLERLARRQAVPPKDLSEEDSA